MSSDWHLYWHICLYIYWHLFRHIIYGGIFADILNDTCSDIWTDYCIGILIDACMSGILTYLLTYWHIECVQYIGTGVRSWFGGLVSIWEWQEEGRAEEGQLTPESTNKVRGEKIAMGHCSSWQDPLSCHFGVLGSFMFFCWICWLRNVCATPWRYHSVWKLFVWGTSSLAGNHSRSSSNGRRCPIWCNLCLTRGSLTSLAISWIKRNTTGRVVSCECIMSAMVFKLQEV